MPAYYLDASALVKRYVWESGSSWLNSVLDQAEQDTFLSSELVAVEVMSAFGRTYRAKRIGAPRRDVIITELNIDIRSLIRTLPVSRMVVRAAGDLAVVHGLRAYDAVHLATALDLTNDLARIAADPLVFISADATLLAAARAEGLRTENPNDHP
jgi:uncharacterized protein